uniref:Uncharacterized protein n=1 Tax=Aegilops tauschii subsp. strangulata TaxID=200361 RepID=A0A452Y9L0_AEGTS
AQGIGFHCLACPLDDLEASQWVRFLGRLPVGYLPDR